MVLGFPALSVALTLAHEREHGTLEQVMATPVGRAELLLGKMIPYIIVGLINVIVMPVLRRCLVPYSLQRQLSPVLPALGGFPVCHSQYGDGHRRVHAHPAGCAGAFFPGDLLPRFFLTGIFFPIASMPEMMRLEAMALPGTHYAIITRGVFLPGVGLDVLWPYGVMLIGLGVAFTAVAALFFRKKLG